TQVRDVLDYLRRRRRELPWQLAADDAWDELVLSAWVYWDERRRERELLHSALHRGLSLSEVGRYLGIGSRQGTRGSLDRLDALVGEHQRIQSAPRGLATGDGATDPLQVWAHTTRAGRGADVHSARSHRAAERARPSRQQWLDTHQRQVVSVLNDLIGQLAR